MKNTPGKPTQAKMKPAEIMAKISAAQKLSDLAKKRAQDAKAFFKRTRKAYKVAKKSAKTARSEVKELKKLLKASKAAIARAKKPAAPKSSPARKTSRTKTVPVVPVIAPTPVVVGSGGSTEGTTPQN